MSYQSREEKIKKLEGLNREAEQGGGEKRIESQHKRVSLPPGSV